MLSYNASLWYYKMSSYSLSIFSPFLHKEKSQFLLHVFSVSYFQMLDTEYEVQRKKKRQQ